MNTLVSNISFQLFWFVVCFYQHSVTHPVLAVKKYIKKRMNVHLILSLATLKKNKSHFSYCSLLLVLSVILGLCSHYKIVVSVQMQSSFPAMFCHDFQSGSVTTEVKFSMTLLESGPKDRNLLTDMTLSFAHPFNNQIWLWLGSTRKLLMILIKLVKDTRDRMACNQFSWTVPPVHLSMCIWE